MSKADELLDNLVSTASVDPVLEGHIIIGDDRVIHVPSELKRIAVQNDHNMETVTFDCPRYWDGIDMSEMVIYINYKLPDGTKARYIADNVRVDTSDSDIMHFDWTIMNNLTQNKGTITFLVCAMKPAEVGIHRPNTEDSITTEAIAYGNGMFVALTRMGIAYSKDGIIWSFKTKGVGVSGFDIAFGDNKFVVISGMATYYSTDGITWAKSDSIGKGHTIAYGNGVFVATSNLVSYYSEDGINWTMIGSTVGGSGFFTGKDIVFGNGKFVAVGGTESYYSTDGINWSLYDTEASVICDTDDLRAVTYIPYDDKEGTFIAAAIGKVFTSLNGYIWNDAYPIPLDIVPTAITYGDGKLVIVGENGAVLYSTNIPLAMNWDEGTGISENINDVIYADGKFLAVGDNIENYYSTDGIVWTVPPAPIENHWNTELNKEMYISEGMECEDAQEVTESDIITQLVSRMDSVFRNVSNGKAMLASAITDKGIVTDANASFETITNNLKSISIFQTAMNNKFDMDIKAYESEVQTIDE